jgi:hypothetical protein
MLHMLQREAQSLLQPAEPEPDNYDGGCGEGSGAPVAGLRGDRRRNHRADHLLGAVPHLDTVKGGTFVRRGKVRHG